MRPARGGQVEAFTRSHFQDMGFTLVFTVAGTMMLAAEGVEYVDTDDLGRYMMRQFDDWCYKERAGASKGNVLFDTMIGSFPSFNGSFPRANRCLKAWRKVRPPATLAAMPMRCFQVKFRS